MRHHKLIRRLYQSTAQIVILLLVTSGYGQPSVYARIDNQPDTVDEQVFSLDELVVADTYPREELFIYGPEQAPQIDVVQRPIAPQEAVLQAQSILSISAGSVITVINTRGVHNDPTLSADGRRVAFWSTSNLAPKRPIANTMFINEVYAYESIYMVEIYNGGIQPVDMTGWDLTEWYGVNTQHVTYTFPSFTLEAGAYIRLYNFSPAYNYPPYYFFTGVDYIYGDGVNDGGAVRLQNSADVEIDFVRWGNSDVNPLLPRSWLSALGNNPLAPRSSYCYQYCFYYGGGYYYCYCMPETLGRNAASFDSNTSADWCRQRYTAGYQNLSTCGLSQDNPDGNIEVYVANVETPELGITEDVTFTQVSRSMGSILGGFNLQPSVSGDGTRIAFFSDRDLIGTNGDENFEIFVYDVENDQIHPITNSLKGANILPSINGDGTRIAFVSDRDLDPRSDNSDGNQEIFVAEVDGSWNVDITQVTETSGDAISDQPSISADGNRIAFVSNWNHQGSTQDDNLEIFVVSIGAGKPYSFVRVTNTPSGVDNEQPSIDGDGSRVAYTQLAGSTSDVYWAEEDTGPWDSTLIPATGAVNENPAINSYGDRIVFVSGQSVMLYYTEFNQVTTLATVLDASIQPSHPDIATTASYLDTWVVFAAGGTLYHAYYPLQDIAIGKTFEPQQVGPGDTVTYTIQFVNYGMYPAPNAYITDSLPAELQSVACDAGGYALTQTPTECRWDLGAVYSGAEGVVTVTAVISTGLPAGYQITNTATITSDPNEPNVANNVQQVVLTVGNVPPDAVDDDGLAYETSEDITLIVPYADRVLANDIDLNGDALNATIETTPTHGIITLLPDGTFTYVPDQDYFGIDTFTYIASDPGGLTDTAKVTITINAVNDAPVLDLNGADGIGQDYDGATFTEDGGAVSIVDTDLSLTDVDSTLMSSALITITNRPNGISETLTAVTVGGIITSYDAASGVLSLSGSDTTINYQTVLRSVEYDNSSQDPGSADRVVHFVVHDDLGTPSIVRTSTVTVIPINDDPEAFDIQRVINEQSVEIITIIPTYTYDPDSPILTIALGTNPVSGTARVLGGTEIVYTPTAVFTNGNDVFTYIVSDGIGTDSATITITVNDRPRAQDDVTSTLEDQSFTVFVLSNDTDIYPDGTLTVTDASDPVSGTVVVNPTSVLYTPDPDVYGTDPFTYTVWDGYMTNTATVFVTVDPVNDPPTFTLSRRHEVDENAGQQNIANWIQGIDPGGLNENSQIITLSLDYAITSGDADLFSEPPTMPTTYSAPYPQAGTLTYTPRADRHGQAVVTVTIQDSGGTLDGGVDSAGPLTFTIVVNAAPTANDGTYSTDEDIPTTPIDIGALTDDPDNYPVSPLSLSLGTPLSGTVVETGVLQVTYTPDPDIYGTDVFTYTVSDGRVSATATITVNVTPANDPPGFVPGPDIVYDAAAGAYGPTVWTTVITPGGWAESSTTYTFTVSNDNNSLFSTQPTITYSLVDGYGYLSFTPVYSAAGTAVVSVSLQDDGGTAGPYDDDTSDPITFTITITNSNVVQAHRTSTAPTIDGNLEAVWDGRLVYSFDKIIAGAGDYDGPADLSGNFGVLWDSTNVYVMVEVIDLMDGSANNEQLNDSPDHRNDNSVNVMFDTDHDAAATYQADDFKYGFELSETVPIEAAHSAITNVVYAYTLLPSAQGYRIEARIPWATLNVTPTADLVFGFDIIVNDDDRQGGTNNDSRKSWHTTSVNAWTNPSLFGDCVLLDP